MSLATSIKDFSDLLTDIYTTKGLTGDFPKMLFFQQTLLYSLQSVISLFVYLLSFQWFRDISYLPLLATQADTAPIFGNNLFHNPASHLFSISSFPDQAKDQFLTGFINSFFLSVPLSLAHLVSIRRLFFQGALAAMASVIGIIAAHSVFLIGVIYGLRFLIIPYFSLEPFNYIVAVLTVGFLIKSLAEQKGFKLVSAWDTQSLVQMGALTFVLTWCEETTIFHTFNHLTLNAQNTFFDLSPGNSAFNSFVTHTTYLLAFFFGHCIFSALFYYLLFMGSRYLSSLRWFTTRTVTHGLSQVMLFLIVAFTVSSFPYYGLDYLVTNIAGFLPEDPAYSNTVFSPTAVKTKYPHFFKEIPPAQRDTKTALNLDVNYFDRGMYLHAPKQHKNVVSSVPLPALSFEELNYQGEYAWLMRNQLSKDLSKMRPSVFTPMFKKPRRKYLQLKKIHDNKLEQAARLANKNTVLGHTTQSKEGILPGERAPLFIKMTDFLGRAFLFPTEIESEMHTFETASHPDQKQLSVTSNGNSEEHIPMSDLKADHDLKFKGEEGSLTQVLDQTETDRAETSSSTQRKDTNSLFFSNPLQRMLHGSNSTKNKKKDPIKEEFVFEGKLQKSYSKGFSPPFSLSYERMRYRYLPIKNVIKKRYFLNKLYKVLLQTDIDTFLSRQPATYTLAENQEFQLFKKRQILQKYYNWLRYYEPFAKMMTLRFRIPDSKSFVDRVYHQQFKGTLKTARRLFTITFDPEHNPAQKRVLSYDQMLYKDTPGKENPSLHEELFHQESTRADKSCFDTCFSCQPFIEESNSSPTYAGWDPVVRRFVVTNRFALTTL